MSQTAQDFPSHDTSPATSKDIEDFIYLISHDVRSSVRALLELPQWIAEDLNDAGFKMTGQVESSIELMNRHTGRLDRMLVDLLTYSRIGRMQTVRTIDLNEALDTVLDALQLPKGFRIVRAFDCPTIVLGDRDILTLLTALIGNALKHHDKAKGRIVVTSVVEGDDVVLGVSDDGPGIADEFHARVFGAMTTLRPRDEVEGSGMGLAHAKKIALHYHGAVGLGPSPYGNGLRVLVRFPRSCALTVL